MGAIVSTAIAVIFNIIPGDFSEWLYCIKWIICYIYIQINRRLTNKRFDYYDAFAENDPVKVNFIPAPEEKVIETPLEEADLFTKADEVFCYGVNSKSECLIVRVARCPNNEAEAWIYLKLSNGKIYQLKQTSGYQQSCCEKKVFSCGGLQMHYISPMRRWRIFYNGALQEIDENDGTSEKLVHVKFSFIWCASSDVFDFKTDIDASVLARSVAKAKWIGFIPPLKKLENLMDCYAQCGIINGTINIENNEDDYNIYLFGERIRFLGDATISKHAEFSYLLGQMTKTGSYVHLAEVSIEHVAEKLSFGFFVHQSGEMSHITDIELSTEKYVKENETGRQIKGKFTVRDEPHIIKGVQLLQPTLFKTNKSWNGFVSIGSSDFLINSLECKGLYMKGKIIETIRTETGKPISKIPTKPRDQPLVVHFHEKPCQDSNFTGGKGSSLGILTELSKELKTFIVPKGIVVTTVSYEIFLTNDILKEISHLEKVLYGITEGDVKDSCHRVIQAITNAEMPHTISQSVNSYLETAFPNKDNMKFAVRSSATGEDTEQMSAAGQMETYLGVMGADEILLSVKKCWASQFSYIAVQYKRQNGQIINSPMAVVIQEMIPCDVAGVLFTCDPLTGNPNLLSITANYGLGESVVSASEEPDTVEIKRDGEENVIIQSKHIGSKKGRIILSAESGTDTVEVSEEERSSCCLSDELIILLGKLALKIEKHYRSRRDIEWGFWNNKLFIFQSRPVTSGSEETVYEIEHEFDAPLRMENDYFTMCNVGEVMPGAFSPLGLEIVMKYFQIAFKAEKRGNWFDEKPKYFPRGLVSMYSHAMFCCLDLLVRMDENKDINDATLVSLFGRVIEDNEMFDAARERFKLNKKSRLSNFVQDFVMLSRLFTAKKTLEKSLKYYANYRIPIENYRNAQNLYDALLVSCTDLTEALQTHLRNTESSSIWNVFVFNILKSARGEINSDVYRDFAKLLMTDTDVESADVPSALAILAINIEKEIKPEVFKKMEIKDIVEWLENSKTGASLKYREFLKKHGHRCLKEFDIHSKTWDTDSETLIKLLKNLVGSTSKSAERKTEKDVGKILSDLGIDFGFKSRLLLKFLIPKSRQGVQLRESAKSLLIKTTNEWRKAYNHLAKLMVQEGRLPDEDILFYMTIEEIGELLETRSPKIIARANHRRRHYPIMEKYIFPEIMKGFPKPINLEQTTIVSNDDNFSMKGIPVSQGVAKAYVRVALSLEEAAELKPGEILLTYSTDIGWSPYFPILAGVVTELGGLISHGAVVSREYGLPCIAGLHGATRQFQTGDYVLLDGNKGILQKLPKPESETAL